MIALLGLRIDRSNRLILTDVAEDHSYVQIFPDNVISSPTWDDFEPSEFKFGAIGQQDGKDDISNSVVIDLRTFLCKRWKQQPYFRMG
jgi:hypothetical protein